MKDWPEDPSHHEWTVLPQSNILLPSAFWAGAFSWSNIGVDETYNIQLTTKVRNLIYSFFTHLKYIKIKAVYCNPLKG